MAMSIDPQHLALADLREHRQHGPPQLGPLCGHVEREQADRQQLQQRAEQGGPHAEHTPRHVGGDPLQIVTEVGERIGEAFASEIHTEAGGELLGLLEVGRDLVDQFDGLVDDQRHHQPDEETR